MRTMRQKSLEKKLDFSENSQFEAHAHFMEEYIIEGLFTACIFLGINWIEAA
jgi:hypothetical protein